MRFPRHILFLSLAAVACSVIASNPFDFLRRQAPQPPTPQQKLMMAQQAISQLYVDSVDQDKLVEDAIKGMLEKLDPHSQYSSPEETRELNEPLQGNFSGIGISFNIATDTLYVIQTISGGPAERVGLLPGDRIIAVNDSAIAGVKMKNSDIQKRLRGPKGTDVDVTVLRHSGAVPDTIEFTITRADIPIYSVDAAYLVDASTGYIRLNKFGAETANEFIKAVKDLKKQGMKQLILDLTDNGGGYLNAATDILGEILEPGELAVYTEGLRSPRYDAIASPKGNRRVFPDGKIVVMVNQYSASASEITAGALQDHDRALIVGRRSFGKGLVQRPVTFPDGSMMRLTVAHYYTPSGRDIQKPYSKGDEEAYRRDIENRFNNGELMHADSIHLADSTEYRTLRLGRTVYGGGGIMPDRFVPLDTTENTKYYRNVVAKGIINKYVISYVDENRDRLKKMYKNDDRFVDKFEVTDEMLDAMRKMADKEEIEFNEEEYLRSLPLFRTVIKSLIGRDLYDQATYFKIFNNHSPIFKEAYKLINSQDYTTLLSPGKSDNSGNPE
ncbi:MAG: S41 family peptidase [Muribaculaceae bacterium]|nr:S41 family peptidase [Muribaculaceae bacterium]